MAKGNTRRAKKKYMGRADIVFRQMEDMHVLQRTWLPMRDWKHLYEELKKIHYRYPEAVVAQVHVELQVYGEKVDD